LFSFADAFDFWWLECKVTLMIRGISKRCDIKSSDSNSVDHHVK
jgi:hypothetical protein